MKVLILCFICLFSVVFGNVAKQKCDAKCFRLGAGIERAYCTSNCEKKYGSDSRVNEILCMSRCKRNLDFPIERRETRCNYLCKNGLYEEEDLFSLDRVYFDDDFSTKQQCEANCFRLGAGIERAHCTSNCRKKYGSDSPANEIICMARCRSSNMDIPFAQRDTHCKRVCRNAGTYEDDLIASYYYS